MKQYPAYKDSGIEWIGKIPVHWQKRRVKSVMDYIVNGIWGEDPVGDKNDIVCVRVADFDMLKLGISKENLTQRNINMSQQNNRMLSQNDILIEKSGGGEKQSVGRVISIDIDEKAVCSNFVGKIAIKSDEIIPRFGAYLFFSMYAIGLNRKAIKQTTGIQNLDTDNYFNEYFYTPSFEEQKDISEFLDRKTAQIDDLIAKKERMIELLKEERSAIINQAVTKGLDLRVEMKDSGIEWLGKVPKQWKVKKLKHVADKVQTGITPPSENASYYDDGNIDWYTPGDFKESVQLRNSFRKINRLAIEKGVARVFLPYSVLLIGIGATLGKVGIIEKLSSSNQQINAITFSDKFNPFFGVYYLQAITNTVISLSNASTLAILNQTQTKDILVLVPPLEEQGKIVQYIQSVELKHAKIVNKEQKQIDLLKEFRTALISEVVTGKIDMRN